jgi:outer membrane protein W
MKRRFGTLVLGSVAVALVLPAALAEAGPLVNRHRLELGAGYWNSGLRLDEAPLESGLKRTSVKNVVGALTYSNWMRENLAGFVTLKGLLAEARSISGPYGDSDTTVVITSALFGMRYYPISAPQASLRPFVAAGIGPFLGVESRTDVHELYRKTTRTRTLGAIGGYLGGGFDMQMGRFLMLGVSAGYNLMDDFPEPLAGERNYSGPEVGISLSFLIG